MDSFSNPELDNFLKKNNVNHLYFTGIDAENCVDKTVKAAFKRNSKVTVISDAVASESDAKRDNKLLEFKGMGADIISTAELLSSF